MPNYRFNADANTCHCFANFKVSVGALRSSRTGAADLERSAATIMTLSSAHPFRALVN
jgi:hypothetical protein